MSQKKLCRKVRKLLPSMPECDCEQTMRLVAEHLSECEKCRSLDAGLRKMEEALIASKVRSQEKARVSPVSRNRMVAGITRVSRRRDWRLRAAWAGAAALVLILAGVVVLLRPRRESQPQVAVTPKIPTAPITRTMAADASSRSVLRTAELVQRYEAPPAKVLAGPPPFSGSISVPKLLERSTVESDKTLRAIAQSRINLTWRNET